MRLSIISLFVLIALAFYASSTSANICRSTGDPHYSTFTGLATNLYRDEGDYLLAKDYKNHMQVVSRIGFSKSWGTNGLNVAVAVKADNNVVEHFGSYYKINGVKNAKSKVLKNGAKLSVASNRWIITTKSGLNTEFHVVKVPVVKGNPSHYFNIYVRVPKTYQGKMKGLCGTYETKAKDTALWKNFKTMKIAPKSRANLFDRKFRPTPGPKVFVKATWKSKAFQTQATKFCKNLKLSKNLYNNCIADAKSSGILPTGYKAVKKDIEDLKKTVHKCNAHSTKRAKYLKLAAQKLTQYNLNKKRSADQLTTSKKQTTNANKQLTLRQKTLVRVKNLLNKASNFKKLAQKNKTASNAALKQYRKHKNLEQSFRKNASRNATLRKSFLSKATTHKNIATKHHKVYLTHNAEYKKNISKYNYYKKFAVFYKNGCNDPSQAHKKYYKRQYAKFMKLANQYKTKYVNHTKLYKKHLAASKTAQKTAQNNQNAANTQNNLRLKNLKSAEQHKKLAAQHLAKSKNFTKAAQKYLKASKSDADQAAKLAKQARAELAKANALKKSSATHKTNSNKFAQLAKKDLADRNRYLALAKAELAKFNKCKQCKNANIKKATFHQQKAAHFKRQYELHLRAKKSFAQKVNKCN